MPIVSLKVIPSTGSPSVSHLVAEAVRILQEHGLEPIVTPDTTVFQMESLEPLGRILARIHERLRELGAQRVVTIVMIDDRFDKPGRRPEELVDRVYEHLGGGGG